MQNQLTSEGKKEKAQEIEGNPPEELEDSKVSGDYAEVPK